MTSREVYDSHAVFQDYPFERLKDNMKSLKDYDKNDNMWIEIKMVQIQQDMKQTKSKKVTIRGYPFWHKHKAKGLLTADVKSSKLVIIVLVCVGIWILSSLSTKQGIGTHVKNTKSFHLMYSVTMCTKKRELNESHRIG
jgi:hypothetical protein